MVFLPGYHVLDTNITFANATRLTWHGGSSSGNIAAVVRNGSVAWLQLHKYDELQHFFFSFYL